MTQYDQARTGYEEINELLSGVKIRKDQVYVLRDKVQERLRLRFAKRSAENHTGK